MIRLTKRGPKHHVDYVSGVHRLRGSLGTASKDVAMRLKGRLENALAEGPDSGLWDDLKRSLPEKTFRAFSEYSGVRRVVSPTWNQLADTFETYSKQRIAMGAFSQQTWDRYALTVRDFGLFLESEDIEHLSEINKTRFEKFKMWKLGTILKKKQARMGTSIHLDAAILHRVFAYGIETGLLTTNPVKREESPGSRPFKGAQPFSAEDLKAMREVMAEYTEHFLLLRWTGLRGSDAADLRWSSVDFKNNEVVRITQKNKKKVYIPMHSELKECLTSLHEARKPKLSEHVLLRPIHNSSITRKTLYGMIVALGKRAEVEHAHPHRFRDTLAVDMLVKGATPYDVAKVLGDTVDMIEKHYTPFVPALRSRVHGILENGLGLEAR